MSDCLYFGDQLREEVIKNPRVSQIHACRLFGECAPRFGYGQYPTCDRCKRHITFADPKFLETWEDPLQVVNQKREPHSLQGLLAGRSTFLVCGGPSLRDLPLEQLNRRGVFSICVNNAAGLPEFKPQAFVCSDPPLKFSHCIWEDPGIIKFVPTPKLSKGRAGYRRKVDKQFVQAGRIVDCPNVWGFRRRSWLVPDDSFFLTEDASWGNHDDGVDRTGEAKTTCTMLLALRLLYYLGSRRIYLLGVDFRMTDKPYAFAQKKGSKGIVGNNEQYRIVNGWLVRLRETFKRFGLCVYNCYERSGLRAFPYVPFEHAIEDVCLGVEAIPDLSGWYEKTDSEEDDNSGEK